jgi:cyclase
MMTVLPAIDLMEGRCVRLKQGRYEDRTTYGRSPLEMARLFERMGYEWLHIIDLEGAKAGFPKNLETVRVLLSQTSLKVQLGGGLRTYEAIADVLLAGVTRVLIGSMAVKEPAVLKRVLDKFGPDRVVVAMDVKDGEVKVSGWLEGSGKGPQDFVRQMVGLGVTTILCTDISRDGMMRGPNVDFYRDLVSAFPRVTWIAAGGVGSPSDRRHLEAVGVQQAVIGKAFYEGSFLAKRVIPCLDVKEGRTVKGVSFTGLRDAGDPVELARRYEQEGADELVFLDITATSDKRAMVAELAGRVAKAISIPFTVGGGIRSIDDIRSALQAGADKVSIESAAVTNPDLISEAAEYFGSQAIVVSVSPKRLPGENRWTLYVKGGREDTGVDLVEFLKDMQTRGAGEILLNSIDEDGRGSGYDLALLKAASAVLKIPLIASSGAGELEHFYAGIAEGGADAVLAASVFHYGKFSVDTVKTYLQERGVPVRLIPGA